MKKIIDFIVGQVIMIIVILCTCELLCVLYLFSGNSQDSIVFYDEVILDNYQVVIDLNTGMIEKNEILKIEFNDLTTSQTYLKIDSIWKLLLISSILLIMILDVIYFIFSILNRIILFFQNLKYKKILKSKYDLTDESLYELPQYEPIIANAIYKKNYQYEMIVARLEYYYKINGVLDKNNKIKEELEFDTNSLTELERMIMQNYQKSKEVTKKLTQEELDAENQKNRKEFKNRINEILKGKGYYKEDIIKIKVRNFFDAIERIKGNKEYFLKSDEVFRNFLIFLVLGFIISSLEIAMWIAIILGLWLLIKYFGISLTQEGEIERAKIIFLINHLKKKKILSEEEKYFLIMLTKY